MFEKYKDIVSIRDITEMLNLSHSTVYSLLQSNQLRHVKVGRKYIVPKKSVIDFANGVCYNVGEITGGRLHSVEKGEIL